jgi:hypothetical protein
VGSLTSDANLVTEKADRARQQSVLGRQLLFLDRDGSYLIVSVPPNPTFPLDCRDMRVHSRRDVRATAPGSANGSLFFQLELRLPSEGLDEHGGGCGSGTASNRGGRPS